MRYTFLEISLAICFFMLGYLANGMIYRSFRMKPDGYVISLVGVCLLAVNWG